MSDETVSDPLLCPGCKVRLQFGVTNEFHVNGSGPVARAFLPGWSELNESRMKADVYVCPRCGRLELFLVGVGEELRIESEQEESPDVP